MARSGGCARCSSRGSRGALARARDSYSLRGRLRSRVRGDDAQREPYQQGTGDESEREVTSLPRTQPARATVESIGGV
jgi:hypothetical protein